MSRCAGISARYRLENRCATCPRMDWTGLMSPQRGRSVQSVIVLGSAARHAEGKVGRRCADGHSSHVASFPSHEPVVCLANPKP